MEELSMREEENRALLGTTCDRFDRPGRRPNVPLPAPVL